MIEAREQSLVELAEHVLKDTREPIDLYELFDLVLSKKGITNSNETEILNKFYSDITTSAKFIYMGNNTWDLKRHQKIELWEKDGSHYHEYKEVEDADMEARLEKQAEEEKAHQEMLELRKQDLIEREARLQAEAEEKLATEEEPQVEVSDELVEDSIIFDEIEAEIDEEVKDEEESKPTEKQDTDTEYTEEDEEEYNKYMDMYEDEYDK